jgi:BCD family chlorophyll transporter-like MFS transporter
MNIAQGDATGLALGAWGAVQASAAGIAIASGGLLSDAISSYARSGRFGAVMNGPATGYTAVYLIELILMFATLVTIGPLARRRAISNTLLTVPFTTMAESST